jgi:hypothetical protein
MTKNWLSIIGIILLLSACKKNESSSIVDIKELYPLQVGKVFIYQMDSTRQLNFQLATAYYRAKDSVVSSFLDNQGRTAFVIYRYIQDTAQKTPYTYSDTYYAVFDKDKVEYVDNNKRFITLANPVSLNTSWMGNKYLDSLQLIISNNTSYDNWNYKYSSCNDSFSVIKGTFLNTYTVQQKVDSTGYISSYYSVEVYAKGVGLIYKEISVNGFQSGQYEDGSFGLKLNLIDYK